MSDWDRSSDDGGKPTAATATAFPAKKTKWEGEEEEKEEKVASDWDKQPDDSDDGKKAGSATGMLLQPKKKGTLKQKLVEKEAERKRRLENGELDDEYTGMRERFTDEQERRRAMYEKELEADMNNASDLFGATSLQQPTTSSTTGKGASRMTTVQPQPQLPSHLSPFLALPTKLSSKADFENLSRLIYANLIKPHVASGQYAAFVENHTKVLCSTLREGETRKVANVVAGLVAEKAAAEKAAAKKKKPGVTAVSGKGMLAGGGGSKGKYDLTAYDEALDDFGGDPDDFM